MQYLINGTRADDLAGTGMFTKRRIAIPLTAQALYHGLRWLGRVLGRLIATAARHPGLSVVLGLAVACWVRFGRWSLLGYAAAVALGLAGWLRLSPGSFDRYVVQPARGWLRWTLRYRRLWYPALHGCGLTRTTPDREVYVPQVIKAHSTRVVDTLHVRLLHGHTPEDLARQGEGLRHAFGAHRVAIIEDAPGKVRVLIYASDPLTRVVPPFPVHLLPTPDQLTSGAGVFLPVALSEAGEVYRLRLDGTHCLIAGATGAGKGSVLQSVFRALGPAIAAGVVRLSGIDPKGGIEFHPARALFTYYTDETPEQMVQLLEAAVQRMQARKFRMRDAGLRAHTPSLAEPFEVITIDELAFLTAYCDTRALKDRIKTALALLTTQGRAVGFCVLAAVQDPRKDVLPLRDLFPTRVALRLAEDSHVDMVLGDGAKDRGALCHRIPDTLPGVGFVLVEGAAEPVRVRFSWIDDEAIGDAVIRWPAPYLAPGKARVIDLTSYDRRDPTPPQQGQRPGSADELEPPGA